MIADIQRLEDAARMAMGHFDAPRPSAKGKVAFYSLHRRSNWLVMCLAMLTVGGLAFL